jgi:hypothetical protein
MLRMPPKFLELDSIRINVDKMFMKLHTSILYDKRLELIKKMFIKKYDLDTMSMFVTDAENKHFLLQHHTDSWNEYNRISFFSGLKYNSFYQEIGQKTLNKLCNLNSSEGEGVEYATITDKSSKGLSADIIGRKLHGYGFFFYNPLNGNKITYIISFKNKTIEDINYSTYVSLVNDLRKNQQALDVFLRYYQMYQVIDNSPLLEAMVANDGFNENSIV